MGHEYQDDATFLAQQVASGAVSPNELLDEAMARLAAFNPDLNAVVLVQEKAARAAIKAGLPDGPFKGVPFLDKRFGGRSSGFSITQRLASHAEHPLCL